jgi:hypothetical protein
VKVGPEIGVERLVVTMALDAMRAERSRPVAREAVDIRRFVRRAGVLNPMSRGVVRPCEQGRAGDVMIVCRVQQCLE